MPNLLQKIGAKIKAAVKTLLRLGDPAVRAKVLDTADAVNDLLQYALPAAELVASLTPDPTDDRIVAALAKMNTTAGAMLSVEDKSIRDVLLLQLAAEVTKNVLSEALKTAGKIKIGGFNVELPDQISDSLVRAAVQYVYSVVIKAAK